MLLRARPLGFVKACKTHMPSVPLSWQRPNEIDSRIFGSFAVLQLPRGRCDSGSSASWECLPLLSWQLHVRLLSWVTIYDLLWGLSHQDPDT